MKNSIYRTENRILISLLKELREAKGLTQADLAYLIDSDQSAISKYENLVRKIDCIELLDICKALEVTPQTIFNLLQEKLK